MSSLPLLPSQLPSVTLSTEDFELIRQLMLAHAGIVLDDHARPAIGVRLLEVARKVGEPHPPTLLRRLRDCSESALLRTVLETISNGETLFFRDYPMWRHLREQLVPQLAAHKGDKQSISVWSAACSTGQEAYSIAMMLSEHEQLVGWHRAVLATDLSQARAEKATLGRYSQSEINRGLPASALVSHFHQVRDGDGVGFSVNETLRRDVQFRVHNLVKDPIPPGVFDVVLLRNVMMYWPMQVRQRVLREVRGSMMKGAVLVVGSSESLRDLSTDFVLANNEEPSIYRAV